jgi:hypothetical protein
LIVVVAAMKMRGDCFSLESTVIKSDNGERVRIPLQNIKVNDKIEVLTKSGIKFKKIITILHRSSSKHCNYLKFTTLNQHGEHTLEISPNHVIMKNEATNPVYAFELKIEDNLLVKLGDNFVKSKIVRIESIVKKGLIAPLTESGTIIVDGILASCFCGTDRADILKAFGSYFDWACYMTVILPVHIKRKIIGEKKAEKRVLNAIENDIEYPETLIPLIIRTISPLVKIIMNLSEKNNIKRIVEVTSGGPIYNHTN